MWLLNMVNLLPTEEIHKYLHVNIEIFIKIKIVVRKKISLGMKPPTTTENKYRIGNGNKLY